MNYSASDDYWNKCSKLDRKLINKSKIRKRWFRNFYVLYQSKGYFTHNTFVIEAGKFDPTNYSGQYYGPFFEKDAKEFSVNLKKTHENFILGG
jgi:hypothetical protein